MQNSWNIKEINRIMDTAGDSGEYLNLRGGGKHNIRELRLLRASKYTLMRVTWVNAPKRGEDVPHTQGAGHVQFVLPSDEQPVEHEDRRCDQLDGGADANIPATPENKLSKH